MYSNFSKGDVCVLRMKHNYQIKKKTLESVDLLSMVHKPEVSFVNCIEAQSLCTEVPELYDLDSSFLKLLPPLTMKG